MPHVIEWWGVAQADDEDDDPNVRCWIVELDGRPFAYAQDYDPHAWADHPFAHLPRGSRGIDQYIGEPALLDRGHGTAFVRAHVARLFDEGAPAVGTDPHPDNLRARAAYRRTGFVETRGPVETLWGTAVLMECYSARA